MTRSLVVALAFAAAPSICFAHAEHLGQSAHVTARSQGVAVELELTPGARVVEGFVRGVDTNGDRTINESEQRAFGARVARDLQLTVDEHRVELGVGGVLMPNVATIETGEATITVNLSAPMSLAPGSHRLCFTNGYAPAPSAWAVNVFSDTASLQLSAPTRSGEGRSLCAAFLLTGPATTDTPRSPVNLRYVLVAMVLAACAAAFAWRRKREA